MARYLWAALTLAVKVATLSIWADILRASTASGAPLANHKNETTTQVTTTTGAETRLRHERAEGLLGLANEVGHEPIGGTSEHLASAKPAPHDYGLQAGAGAGLGAPSDFSDFSGGGGDNETQNNGPLLELNALEAAERGYFRHSISASVVVTIAYSMIFIIGLIGNSFVVTIVCKSPRMRTVTNYFIANLALADILVLLFCLPATLVGNLFIPYVLGQWVCKTVSYLQGVAVSASINTMVAVTMDRFLAICFPMDWHMSRRTARWTIACIWLFSLSIALPWALFFKLVPYPHDGFTVQVCIDVWPSAQMGNLYFVFANLILLYLVPAVVITFCYLGIWYKIERRDIPGDRPKGLKIELIMQKSKLKVIKMMMVVVLIFLLSWFPTYVIFVRLKLFGEERGELEDWLIRNTMPFAQWLGASNSCINPILYTFFNRKYKRGLVDLLRCAFCCQPLTKASSLSGPSQCPSAAMAALCNDTGSLGGARGRHQRSRYAQNGALSMASLNATPNTNSGAKLTCNSIGLSSIQDTCSGLSLHKTSGSFSERHLLLATTNTNSKHGEPKRAPGTNTNSSATSAGSARATAANNRTQQCGCKMRLRAISARARPRPRPRPGSAEQTSANQAASQGRAAKSKTTASSSIQSEIDWMPRNLSNRTSEQHFRLVGPREASGGCGRIQGTIEEPETQSEFKQSRSSLSDLNEDSARAGRLKRSSCDEGASVCLYSNQPPGRLKQRPRSRSRTAPGAQEENSGGGDEQALEKAAKRVADGEQASDNEDAARPVRLISGRQHSARHACECHHHRHHRHHRHHHHNHHNHHNHHSHQRHHHDRHHHQCRRNRRRASSKPAESQRKPTRSFGGLAENLQRETATNRAGKPRSGTDRFEQATVDECERIELAADETEESASLMKGGESALKETGQRRQLASGEQNGRSLNSNASTTTTTRDTATIGSTDTTTLSFVERAPAGLIYARPSDHSAVVVASRSRSRNRSRNRAAQSNASERDGRQNKLDQDELATSWDEHEDDGPRARLSECEPREHADGETRANGKGERRESDATEASDNQHDERCERGLGCGGDGYGGSSARHKQDKRHSDRRRRRWQRPRQRPLDDEDYELTNKNNHAVEEQAEMGVAGNEDGQKKAYEDYELQRDQVDGVNEEEEEEEDDDDDDDDDDQDDDIDELEPDEGDMLFGSDDNWTIRRVRLERLRAKRQRDQSGEQIPPRREQSNGSGGGGGGECEASLPLERAANLDRSRSRGASGEETSGYQVAIKSLASGGSNLANLAMQKLSSSCKFRPVGLAGRRKKTNASQATAAAIALASPVDDREPLAFICPPGGRQPGAVASCELIDGTAGRQTGVQSGASGALAKANMQNDLTASGRDLQNENTTTTSATTTAANKKRAISASLIIKSNVMRENCYINIDRAERGLESHVVDCALSGPNAEHKIRSPTSNSLSTSGLL